MCCQDLRQRQLYLMLKWPKTSWPCCEATGFWSPAGGWRITELFGVWRQQALIHGGLHWKEMSMSLPTRQGSPRYAGPGEGVATAESAEHQHGSGLLCGVAGGQTGHRECQVHRREHEESQQGQRGEWLMFFTFVWEVWTIRLGRGHLTSHLSSVLVLTHPNKSYCKVNLCTFWIDFGRKWRGCVALTDEKTSWGGGDVLNGGSAERASAKSYRSMYIITTNSDLLSYSRWNPIFACRGVW